MTAAGKVGAALLFAAAGAAQFLLQQPLRAANAVRASRELHTAPSSLAFRLAAGGVKEAASDALWLTVLPRLGRPWAEPERKAAWIESVTGVMLDANPRAATPVRYSAFFLEFIRKRHPGIERLHTMAMEAEARAPFRERRKVNADSWEFAHDLGMNLFLYGTPEEKAAGREWLRYAAARPGAPTILIDVLAAEGGRAGNPLEGWDLWLVRAANETHAKFRDYYLQEGDRARLEVLRKWARRAEERLGRWPSRVDEVMAEAPESVLEELRARPDRRAALVEGVRLHPHTRDIDIASLTNAQIEEARESLRLLARRYQAEHGRPPRTMQELQSKSQGPILPPPLHGTRWDVDPATGHADVAPFLADPRVRQ